jgi:hypothetical protein
MKLPPEVPQFSMIPARYGPERIPVRMVRLSDYLALRAEIGAAPENTFGCALAMRVLQSPLYNLLDDTERAECDELIQRWLDHLRAEGKNIKVGT